MIPTLNTERLILRPFSSEDAKNVRELANNFAIADTTLNVPHPYPNGAAEKWIATHAREFENGSGVTFAIERKLSGTLIGAISLVAMTPNHQAELGYWIGQPSWGWGFGTEAAQEVIRYAFENLGLMRVHSQHMTRNPASGRIMEKIGMTHEGHRPAHKLKWGKPEGMELYGILRPTS